MYCEIDQDRLISAIESKDKDAIINAIDLGAVLKIDEDDICWSKYPLIAAVQTGDLEIISLLLDLGADVNAHPERSDLTALYFASKSQCCPETVKLLISAGVNLNVRYLNSTLIAHLCYFYDNREIKCLNNKQYEILQLFLEHGVDTKTTGKDDPNSLFQSAIESNDIRTVKLLLTHKVKSTQARTYDAACEAASKGSYEVLKLLLEHKFKPTPKKNKGHIGQGVLQSAIYGGHKNIVRLLLEYGATIEEPTHPSGDYYPANVYTAAKVNSKEIMKLLLEAGSNPDGGVRQKPLIDIHPLTLAVMNHNSDIVEMLIQYGANTSPVDYFLIEGEEINYSKKTPLDISIEKEFSNITEILIANGAQSAE